MQNIHNNRHMMLMMMTMIVIIVIIIIKAVPARVSVCRCVTAHGSGRAYGGATEGS